MEWRTGRHLKSNLDRRALPCLERKERKLSWAFAWASGSRACDELPEAYRCPNRCGWNSSTQNSVVAVIAFVALLELDSRVAPG